MSFVAMKSLDDLLWLASRCLGSEYRKVAEAKKKKKIKNNRRSGMEEREARFVRQARRRSVITELFPLRLSRLTRCVFSSWLINRSTRNTDRRTSRRMDAWSGQKILGISTWIFILFYRWIVVESFFSIVFRVTLVPLSFLSNASCLNIYRVQISFFLLIFISFLNFSIELEEQ